MEKLTTDKLNEWLAVCEAAPEGPYACDGGQYVAIVAIVDGKPTQIGRAESFGQISDETVEALAKLFALVRTALPEVIRELIARNEEVAELNKYIEDLKWAAGG